MGKFKFENKPNQKSNQQAPSNNDKKTSEKIFKFSPQVVGQKNNFATFATVKEKSSDARKSNWSKDTTSKWPLNPENRQTSTATNLTLR